MELQPLRDQAAALQKAGSLAEAASLYERILAAAPQDFTALHQLGIIRFQQQQFAAALDLFAAALAVKPDAVSSLVMRGLALQASGRAAEALANYDRALALDGANISALTNRGIALKDLGRPQDALDSFDRALVLRPQFPAALINRGNILRELHRAAEALASYDRALAILPDSPAALAGRGHLLLDRGEIAAAIASHRQALARDPAMSDAWIGLGNALMVKGELAEAEDCYRRAPGDAVAAENLALLLLTRGDAAAALEIVKPLLQAGQPGNAGRLFGECVMRLPAGNDGEIRRLLTRALAGSWARPSALAQSAAAHLKADPGKDEALLCALLCATPNADADLEHALTAERRSLLAKAQSQTDRLEFYAALARQCFINDYVFAHDADEIREARVLRDALAAALETGAPVEALMVVAVAAYFPLGSVTRAERLLGWAWPDAVQALLRQQILEPRDERQMEIPVLTAITQPVSRQVQSQYEESPYPRWVAAPAALPVPSLAAYLARKFPLAQFPRGGVTSEILIAGCGTGQHSVATAQKFSSARILAVDLSRASLAYAKRKSLGLDNIEYAQADLLALTDRQFDAIESVGVLHHLADPFAGWRSLLGLLRPGGFMMLGFYSATARRGIAAARAFIAEQGFGATPDEIRHCRQLLLQQPERFADAVAAPDFYSLSGCRDLLFHVQEQALTLPQIAGFLAESRLTFVGFEIDAAVLARYRQRFSDDPAATDLARWDRFERENPGTFAGMYQFWVSA